MEQPITKILEEDITMLEDIIASLPQTEVPQGQMESLPTLTQKKANGNSYDKIPCKNSSKSKKGKYCWDFCKSTIVVIITYYFYYYLEEKGDSLITSSQKEKSSGIYDIPVTDKNPKRSSEIYDIPVTQKKIQPKNKPTNSCPSDKKNIKASFDNMENSEGYSIPTKRNKKKLETVSFEDRRDKDIGYENPDPHQRLSKAKGKAFSKKSSTLSNTNSESTPLSLHYAVSAGKISATLPPKSRRENQYHVLESPTPPQEPITGGMKGNRESNTNQYFTLEPPKSKKVVKVNSQQKQPPVYHTLEQPTLKHAAVGTTTSMPVNNNTEAATSKDDYSLEYAIPIDHIRRDIPINLSNTCQTHEYHVLESPN